MFINPRPQNMKNETTYNMYIEPYHQSWPIKSKAFFTSTRSRVKLTLSSKTQFSSNPILRWWCGTNRVCTSSKTYVCTPSSQMELPFFVREKGTLLKGYLARRRRGVTSIIIIYGWTFTSLFFLKSLQKTQLSN